MSHVKTLYECGFCRRTYKTKKQALSCAKLFEKDFKKGDLVVDRDDNRVWRVLDISCGMVALERVNEAIKLKGFDNCRGWQASALSYPAVNCNKRWRLLTKEDVMKDLPRRRDQVRCGEKLLEMLK